MLAAFRGRLSCFNKGGDFLRIQLSDHFTYGKLMRFTLPCIATMIFTSIYSIVDGFFISNFAGKTPFAAINFIMPILMILGTTGFMFGTGGTAIVSKTFGEGKSEEANRYFSLFIYTALATGIILAVLGYIFMRPIASALGASGELLENSMLYSKIILAALPFYVLQVMFQSFFVAAEKPHLGLFTTISSGVTNMILDAVLVILLPKEYKLAGAATATALSQVVGGTVPLIYFARKNSSILRLGKTKYDGKIIRKACVNGSSEFMSNISMSLVGMLYNLKLMEYAGENGLAAYGVMMYVSMIFAAVFIGYTVGTAPVFGFHNGAQNFAELKGLLRKSMILIGIFGLAMTACAQVLAKPLAHIFVGYDKELMEMTVFGFKLFALSFLFMGFGIFISGFFTALNDGVTSAAISFLRTLVLQSGAVMIMPMIFDINGIWLAGVTAEFAAVLVGLAFLVIKRRKYQY